MTRARKQTLVKIISYILLIILTAATLMPLLWMLSRFAEDEYGGIQRQFPLDTCGIPVE